MTTLVEDFAAALSRAEPSALAIVLVFAVAGGALQFLQWRFRDKGAAGALALVKWICALAALHVLDARVLQGLWETPVLILYCAMLWMAFRTVLYDIYAGLYLARLKKRQASKILLTLLSFAAGIVLVGYVLRQALHVDVGSILTSSAIITAVVGFSMQDTIGSMFSGLLIQTEKPFKPGDWIRIGDVEGQVAEMTWRYTKLVNFSNDQVLIPNNAIVKERLTNISEPIRQVSVAVAVPAPLATPPVKVKSALEEVLRKSSLVAPLPEPRVRLHEIGPDHATYRMAFFVGDFTDTVAAKSEVLSAVWYEFRNQGIEFPMTRRMLVPCRGGARGTGQDVSELLKGIELFQGMRTEELDLLVQCAAVRAFPTGARIVERGQGGTTMFIIAAGHVAVRLGDTELSRLGPGEVFGEMALLTGEPRQADVVALEPVSCLEVDREAFRGVLEKNPVLLDNVNRAFKERVEKMRGSARQEAEESAEGLFERFRRIFW